MSRSSDQKRSTINASSKGTFRILSVLSRELQPIGVLELARLLGIPASTAHRGLATLEDSGFVSRDEGSLKYSLGLSANRGAIAFLARFPLRSVSIPYLRQLSKISGQTAALWVKLGWYAVKIAAVEGADEIVGREPLGKYARLDRSDHGLALLAVQSAAFYDASPFRKSSVKRRVNELRVLFERDGYISERSSGATKILLPIAPQSGPKFAVLATDGMGGGVTSQRLSEAAKWRGIRRALEAELVSNPQLGLDPFAHIEPSEIALDESEPAR
jgi:IclR family transcriptional regulator, KDG regulon repressor